MIIRLAEDTRDLNRVETAVLEHAGYTVDSVFDGQEAIDAIEKNGYDLVILDVMMPKKTGIEVVEQMRRENITTPVLMLTAKTEVDDRCAGLDAGADDYLAKPFALKELLARVRALTRRKKEYGDEKLSFADLTLDGSTFELVSENTVRLSVKEYELLETLMQNRDRELDTDYLLEKVWGSDPEATPDTVWLYVSYLRGKLRSVASKVTISGERGGSYRLLMAVREQA